MYKIAATVKFKRELRLAIKRGYDISLLEDVVSRLSTGETLAEKFNDHALSGRFAGCRECHIKPDWLLIYEISEQELLLYLMRTGTHSDLFG